MLFGKDMLKAPVSTTPGIEQRQSHESEHCAYRPRLYLAAAVVAAHGWVSFCPRYIHKSVRAEMSAIRLRYWVYRSGYDNAPFLPFICVIAWHSGRHPPIHCTVLFVSIRSAFRPIFANHCHGHWQRHIFDGIAHCRIGT